MSSSSSSSSSFLSSVQIDAMEKLGWWARTVPEEHEFMDLVAQRGMGMGYCSRCIDTGKTRKSLRYSRAEGQTTTIEAVRTTPGSKQKRPISSGVISTLASQTHTIMLILGKRLLIQARAPLLRHVLVKKYLALRLFNNKRRMFCCRLFYTILLILLMLILIAYFRIVTCRRPRWQRSNRCRRC